MKKVLKYTGILLLLALLSIVCYVKFALPNVGPPEDLHLDATKTRLERGRYLANSICACMDCHSTRDWSKFSGPLVEGSLGKGGETFDQKFGFPGRFYSKNLTPEGIGSWTDGELLRAIASGVSKDGKALFPVMPHANYGRMEKEDLYSIIAYLRTLAPIKNTVPESKADFPMSFIINTIPKKAEYTADRNEENTVAHGAYIFNAAACAECHTKQEKGKPVAGMELAGGFEFPLPTGGIVRSANITSDKETGIGKWTEEAFVRRFKAYADSAYAPHTVAKGTFNTSMPWMMYRNMTEDDLKDLFAFLQREKPVSNSVEKFTP
jgi:cytochrome c2